MDFLDIIWIVVCIVLVAVPDLVFNNKKKKSASGRTRTSGPMPQMPENFPMPPMPSVPSESESMPIDDEEDDFPVWAETEPEVTEEQPEPQVHDVEPRIPVVEQPKPVVEQPKPVIEQPKPVVVKEVSRRPASPAPQTDSSQADDGKKGGKLRVDPRNLVIYTAIMEPKFKEM